MNDNITRENTTDPFTDPENRAELPPMVPIESAPYATPIGDNYAMGTAPVMEVGGHESEYRELVKLSAYFVKTVLDMLVTNPMVKGMLGPDFESEAATVSNRITELMAVINPNNDPIL